MLKCRIDQFIKLNNGLDIIGIVDWSDEKFPFDVQDFEVIEEMLVALDIES